MKTPPPGGMTIPISIEAWQKLCVASIKSGYTLEAWEIGAKAVHEWLARHSPESLAMPCTSGYQWKQLFLPKGTLLRTVFNGKHYHCLVEEDGLRFNGEPTSPSRFANAVGGVRRNAWRVIWVLFPDTSEWRLADSLRTRRSTPRRPARRPAAEPPVQRAQGAGERLAAERVQARGSERRRASPDRRNAFPERRRHAAVMPARASHAAGKAPEHGEPAARQVITWRVPAKMATRSMKNKRHPQVPLVWAGPPYT